MVKVPVKFRDSLKISSDLKDFIRKCLEINESKRMSLEGLVEWIQEQEGNDEKQNRENVFLQPPKLTQKNTTFEKLESRPLSELTNKMPVGNNSKSVNKLKVNATDAGAKEKLSKSTVAFNNNLVIK